MALSPIEEVEILRASCCVAGADGDCSESEFKVLRRLADNVGVGKASFDAMVERAVTDPNFYKQQFRILKSQPRLAMSTLLEVATADNQVDVEEARILRALAENLELPSEVFNELVQEAAAKIEKRS